MLERSVTQTGEIPLPEETAPEQQDLIDHVPTTTETQTSRTSLTHQESRDGSPAESVNEGGVFIPAPPAEVTADQGKHADPFAAAEIMNAGNHKAEVKPAKKAGLSLFERVTGVALGDRRAERKERIVPVPPSAASASESTETSEVKPIAASIEGCSNAPEMRDTVQGELAELQAELSSGEAAMADMSPELVGREQTEIKPASEPEPASQAASELVPEAASQNKPQVNVIPRQGSEQVLQPETASDSGSVASSELVEGLSLEKDAAGGIEEPALIEDFPAESILSDPKEKEDLLDIPAFLRRQAN